MNKRIKQLQQQLIMCELKGKTTKAGFVRRAIRSVEIAKKREAAK